MTFEGRRCLCGAKVRLARNLRDFVAVCETGEHVTVGQTDPRVYVYVENPGDVIEVVDHCWLCGGVDPNETVTVAREHPNGPKCPAYKTKVHTGCWRDIDRRRQPGLKRLGGRAHLVGVPSVRRVSPSDIPIV